MQWSDFQPYVLPYVAGCPDPVVEHHARLAAIEFCRRTLCMTQALAPVLSDGVTTAVTLNPGTGLQVVKVQSLTVGGVHWTLVPTEQGRELVDAEVLRDFAFSQSPGVLEVYQLQAANTPVVVTATVAPDMAATTCPDALLPFMADISHGIAASIQMIPGQDFTNPQHAMAAKAAFEARISSNAARISRGQSSAKMRSRATFL